MPRARKKPSDTKLMFSYQGRKVKIPKPHKTPVKAGREGWIETVYVYKRKITAVTVRFKNNSMQRYFLKDVVLS